MEVCIVGYCLDCGEPIKVRMRDNDILEVNPPTIVGHMNLPRVSLGEVSDAFR